MQSTRRTTTRGRWHRLLYVATLRRPGYCLCLRCDFSHEIGHWAVTTGGNGIPLCSTHHDAFDAISLRSIPLTAFFENFFIGRPQIAYRRATLHVSPKMSPRGDLPMRSVQRFSKQILRSRLGLKSHRDSM